jgi:YidC/Oxa1 family membrane protein insertase
MYIGFDPDDNVLSGKIYLGPQDVTEMKKTETNIEEAMNWGYFFIRPISKFILKLLKFLHSPFPGFQINYGIVLILFAFIVRLLTGPLTKKATVSNQKIQQLQPQIKKLQAKHKEDPMKLNKETMALWKKHKVNPLGGCLPIIIQMPLLFALFVTFRTTIEFRGEPFFLWITDLSQPDIIVNLPFSIPIYGAHIAILPLFMGITMFFQQKFSSATMDSSQKPVMYIMTGFFFLIFNSFPSGLNLYYATSNILNIVQQWNLKKTTTLSTP